MSPVPPSGAPIAYLTGEYPRATDTFIQREVAALRVLGQRVLTCSIRRTAPYHHVSAETAREAGDTFHVFEAARRPVHLLRCHLALIRTAPRRYAAGLWLALRSGGPGFRAWAYQLFYFAEAGVLARRMMRDGIAHLHNHFSDSSCSVAMLASALSGIPYSFTMHGPAVFFEPRRWRIDLKIARAAFVACISHFCRSQGMLFADQVHWSKMHIVHCGVDPALYDRPHPPHEGLRMLFVGRLAAIKGIPVLFSALQRVRARYPDLHLTLVGDGPERQLLEETAARLGLADNVSFVGYKPQEAIAAYLAESDIFVLPSFAEGVPVVLMEAMAARLPVIATAVGGVAELVKDGRVGYLVPPGDQETLATRIATLAADRERRDAMGQAGRQHVIDGFDSHREAARLLDLFQAYSAGRAVASIRPATEAQPGAVAAGEAMS